MTMIEATNRLRNFIKDHEALNVILEREENSNAELEDFIVDALDEINHLYPPKTAWTIDTIGSWNLLKYGAVLQLLTSNGILSARNTYNYSDGFGINISDQDYWGRYINYYNVLVNKYLTMVTNYKRAANIESCYGGLSSDYWNL